VYGVPESSLAGIVGCGCKRSGMWRRRLADSKALGGLWIVRIVRESAVPLCSSTAHYTGTISRGGEDKSLLPFRSLPISYTCQFQRSLRLNGSRSFHWVPFWYLWVFPNSTLRARDDC